MKRLYILTILSFISACIIYSCKGIKTSTIPAGKGLVIEKSWLVNADSIQTPIKDRRPPDQTFLTYPEWFLVFSSAEQVEYFKTHSATHFPYLTHTHQIWKSYSIVKDQIKGNFKYNFGYHAMIKVIGISTTLEYGFKSIYEKSVGRLTDLGNKGYLTPEDTFYQKYISEYVDFIKIRPWYEFNFIKRLPQLWKTPLIGKHPIRKIERKLFLTSELLIKTIYGFVIKLGTKAAYDEALPSTIVMVNKLPATGLEKLTKLKIEKMYPDSSALISIPRYDEFNSYVTELALRDVSFKEIAGNTTAILLSVIVPSNQQISFDSTQTIFTQSISSAPENKRIAFAVQIKDLNNVLKQLNRSNISIEHVFDF